MKLVQLITIGAIVALAHTAPTEVTIAAVNRVRSRRLTIIQKPGNDAVGYLIYGYKKEKREEMKRGDDAVGYLTYGYTKE
jgi:hypothetical protein